MKKKILTVLLAACAAGAAAFGLSACNVKDDSSEWGNEYSFAAAYAQAQDPANYLDLENN